MCFCLKTPTTVPSATEKTGKMDATTPQAKEITETDEYDETDYDDYDDEFKNVGRTTQSTTVQTTTTPKTTVSITIPVSALYIFISNLFLIGVFILAADNNISNKSTDYIDNRKNSDNRIY